jgi:sugar/nucleoside kinase (ribokinase family)
MVQAVLCTGYPSFDHLARVHRPEVAGGTRVIKRHWTEGTAGGCAANVAVALGCLGLRAGVGFAVGSDAESGAYLKLLEQAGVDTALVDRLEGERMPRSYFFVDDAGECELFFDPAASRAWAGPEHLDLTGCHWLVVTVGPPGATKRFMREARRQGIPVVWQLKRDREAFPTTAFQEYLAASEIVFANEAELQDLCHQLAVGAPADLLQFGPKTIVVTLGARGARLTDENGTTEVPALPVTSVDATGAGDAFTAGFLFGAYHQLPKLQCLRLAAVLASFAVEAWGCQSNLPSLEEAMQRYERAFDESLSPFVNWRHR